MQKGYEQEGFPLHAIVMLVMGDIYDPQYVDFLKDVSICTCKIRFFKISIGLEVRTFYQN